MNSETMRALIIKQPGEASIESVPRPRLDHGQDPLPSRTEPQAEEGLATVPHVAPDCVAVDDPRGYSHGAANPAG